VNAFEEELPVLVLELTLTNGYPGRQGESQDQSIIIEETSADSLIDDLSCLSH